MENLKLQKYTQCADRAEKLIVIVDGRNDPLSGFHFVNGVRENLKMHKNLPTRNVQSALCNTDLAWMKKKQSIMKKINADEDISTNNDAEHAQKYCYFLPTEKKNVLFPYFNNKTMINE